MENCDEKIEIRDMCDRIQIEKKITVRQFVWITCPRCMRKTRNKVFENTVLINFHCTVIGAKEKQ